MSYNDLQTNTQLIGNVASAGSINSKTPYEAYELIEVMASNNYEKASNWNMLKKVGGRI